MRKLHCFFFATLCHFGFAQTLPEGLVPLEVQSIVAQIAQGTATKALGQFSTLHAWWPGVKLGFEFNYFQAFQIEEMGRGNSELQSSYPSIRFAVAKKWPGGIETLVQYTPYTMLGSVGGFGALLQFPVYQDSLARMNVYPFGAFTKALGFNETFESTAFELGAMVNKEFSGWKPYLGAGFLFANGAVSQSLMRQGSNEAGYSTLHIFGGASWDFYTNLNTTVQIDFMNLAPRASLSGFLKF